MRTITLETELGPSRVTVYSAPAPRAVLLLGHGAGGGIGAFDLGALAERLPSAGIGVVLHEQPWRVAGMRIATRPPTLDVGWRPSLDWALGEYPGLPVWAGGRSAGARVACRCFDARQAGVVCLAFPLHPPGRPESSRIAELGSVAGPVLVLQGQRDPFGRPDEVRAALAAFSESRPPTPQPKAVDVVAVPGAHSFLRRAEVKELIVTTVAERIRQA